MPSSVGTPNVSELFPTTSGTSKYLNYRLPTPNISSGGQSTLSPPLAGTDFSSQAVILIMIGRVQISAISLSLQGELAAEDFRLISGPVSSSARRLAARATGGGIRSKELQVVFEDEN